MAKQEGVVLEGNVIECLPNATFRVQVSNSDHIILCTLSGKMRQNKIRVLLGDFVQVEVSPYDLTRGRIIYRKK